jgi:hypothetical protein
MNVRKQMSQLELTSIPEFVLKVVDRKKLTFRASFGTVDVCDSTGKRKTFRDVDTLVQSVLADDPSVTEIKCYIDTAGVRVFKIPSDPISSAAATKVRLQAERVRVVTTRTKLVAQLAATASYENSGNAALEAAFAETEAQKLAVDGVIEYLDEQIVVQNGIIGPNAPAPSGS